MSLDKYQEQGLTKDMLGLLIQLLDLQKVQSIQQSLVTILKK